MFVFPERTAFLWTGVTGFRYAVKVMLDWVVLSGGNNLFGTVDGRAVP
jgi:hypothetical protein